MKLKTRLFSIAICFVLSHQLLLADGRDSTFINPNEAIESNLENNLDSLLNLWYVENSINTMDLVQNLDSHPLDTLDFNYPDSLFIERLSKIPSAVDLTYNQTVRNYIKVYTVKRRETVEVMLGLADYYFPIFDDIFDYYGVPNEMKYMAIIESALNPKAYSRTRAVGLWQFMYGTARMYGLDINSYVDERRDAIKATHAAARFVKDLYDIYGDWTLVIAAYNCGPGNVNKAIRRSGGKRNYWDIYYYLPRETRGHIPAYIAAVYTMHYFGEHELYPRPITLPIASDTIMVREELHFKQVSEVLNIPLKQLRDMNPQYSRDIIPGTGKPYALTIPLKYTADFIDMQDSIMNYKDSIFFNKDVVVAPVSRQNTFVPAPPSANMTKVYYTVQPGDNLGFISSWYNVRLSDLRYWNNIRRNMIRSGQKLTVYVPKKKVDHYKKINAMSFADKQRMVGASVTANQSNASSTTTASAATSNGSFVYYKVRSGDTIWEIAKNYPNVSEKDIISINNFSYNEKIHPGQQIKIKAK